MDNGPISKADQPLLRTLAPALRQLHLGLRAWLDSPHRSPLSTLARATLEGIATDLQRQADALDADQPLLIIMLMGGTGVGKSTLLNALAGGAIAQASVARPTTRDPVVYYHESIRTERLDPVLRLCRLAPHDRPNLQQKIIVDTPDLDSNDLANRDKLLKLLPVADVVLYVGSQEKYHDKMGWELFLQQRRRRAFAFVLNKWDRCQRTGPSGIRPDQDLTHDLQKEGFKNPLLFRTCAQYWVDRISGMDGQVGTQTVAQPPEGEQFPELTNWLEQGLTRLEIEAIKARGVGQLLEQMQEALKAVCPPDLTDAALRTRAAWTKQLAEEANATASVLLNSLEPYQREIEHHFAMEGQRHFRGIMALYLRLFTRTKYVGSTLSGRIPFMPSLKNSEPSFPSWDLATFTRACSDAAANRQLTARGKALANRLLVTADEQGFPVELLTAPVETVAELDWRQRYARALSDVLQAVEHQSAQPSGVRRLLYAGVVFLGNLLPPVVLLAAFLLLLWKYFDPMGKGYNVNLLDVFLPFIMVLIVLVLLQILSGLVLPLRWSRIRSTFEKQLEQRLVQDLEAEHLFIPHDVAEVLRQEREKNEQLRRETGEVAAWLREREKAASISAMYGDYT